MVAHTPSVSSSASANRKTRFDADTLVRRSPVLSLGAKLVWLELSQGWAWRKERTCFPHQDVLALALSTSRRSIIRWIQELEDHKLLLIDRRQGRRGNKYHLAQKIPEKVCDPQRLDNRWLAHQIFGDAVTSDEVLSSDTDVTSNEEDPTSSCDTGVTSDDAFEVTTCHLSCDTGVTSNQSEVTQVSLGEVTQVSLVYEATKMKPPRKMKDESEARVSRSSASPSHASEPVSFLRSSGHQDGETTSRQSRSLVVSTAEGSQSPESEAEMEDLNGLIEDDDSLVSGNKRLRSKRGRRAPDPALVQQPGDGLRTATKRSAGPGQVEASPPPPWEPENVLALLRGEIDERFGRNASRGLSTELTSKEKGQIENAILRKYPPDVVLAMVRVLVWDWEVARTTIFPYRPGRPLPLIQNLVQYAKDLAAAISTGLPYRGDQRGALNTYSDRYLEHKSKIKDDDPF